MIPRFVVSLLHKGYETGNSVYFWNALPPNWLDFSVGFRCVEGITPAA